MKICAPVFALVASGLPLAEGFSTVGTLRSFQKTCTTRQTLSSASRVMRYSTIVNDETKTSDFGSAMPEEVDPHDIIGVEPEKLALGISPSEFLEWVGTKEQLMEKFQADNKSFSPERVEEEVDRFMMDAESVNMYIGYLKDRKSNPQKYANEALEAELSLSNPKTLALYAAWLIGGLSFGYIKNEFIEPKFASGEWKELHLSLPFLSKPDAAAETISTVSQAIDSAIQQGSNMIS